MTEKYYVIRATEDGPRVSEMDQATLEKRLAEEYYGEGERAPKWGTTLPDLESCEGAIIIRGTPVVPKPVNVVKTWSVT